MVCLMLRGGWDAARSAATEHRGTPWDQTHRVNLGVQKFSGIR